MSEWMPIETAPTDGSEFQAWVINDDNGFGFWEPKCRFNKDGAFEMWGRVDYDIDGWAVHYPYTATHWMPLPPPPETTHDPR